MTDKTPITLDRVQEWLASVYERPSRIKVAKCGDLEIVTVHHATRAHIACKTIMTIDLALQGHVADGRAVLSGYVRVGEYTAEADMLTADILDERAAQTLRRILAAAFCEIAAQINLFVGSTAIEIAGGVELRRSVLELGDRESAKELYRECKRQGLPAFGHQEIDECIFDLFGTLDRADFTQFMVLRTRASHRCGEMQLREEVTSESLPRLCRLLALLHPDDIVYFATTIEIRPQPRT